MTVQPSTVRASARSSVEDQPVFATQRDLIERVWAYWRAQSVPGVLAALQEFPSLVHQKSLVLDLALEEYKSRRSTLPDLSVTQFSRRFHDLNSSLRRSIIRLLEVQDYLDQHPELLDLVEAFEWPRIGDMVQGFQVIDELGRGAVARVYLCRESEVGQRVVVLKVTRSGKYEADLLGRLNHPNIMPVYSITSDVDRLASYICMPFRGRCTLQDIVDQVFENGVPGNGAIMLQVAELLQSPAEFGLMDDNLAMSRVIAHGSYVNVVIHICCQIVDALSHAHRKGVLHGDLKPSNVLFTTRGQPLLIDFNLGKAQWADRTPCGGTLPYMAPQQLTAISRDTGSPTLAYDVRDEVYSFGVMLFQLLAGRLPFQIDDASTDSAAAAEQLLVQQRKTVPLAKSLNPRINSSLEALLQDCLAWDASRRPSSMESLLARLRLEAGFSARIRRFARARPAASAIGVGTMAILVGSLAAFLALRAPYHVRQYDRGLALQRAGDFESAVTHFENALTAKPDFPEALYESSRARLKSGDLDEAISGFSRLSAEFDDVRGLAYAGYCFNLLQQPTAAIDKYERALAHGFESSGLHNNLGISYATARSRLDYRGRLTEAERHLNRAFALDSDSAIVRFNLVELAIQRGLQDADFALAASLTHVVAMTDAFPEESEVWTSAARYYGLLSNGSEEFVERALEALRLAIRLGGGPTKRQLADLPEFRSIRSQPQFKLLCEAAEVGGSSRADRPFSRFLDPVDSSRFVRVSSWK